MGKSFFVYICLGVSLLLSSCNYSSVKNIKDCSFALHSISGLMFDNVSMDGKRTLKDLSPADFTTISRGLMTETPISFTAHVSISNPNNQKAELSALEWILLIKDIEVANGVVNKKIKIGPNQQITVPINVETNTGILKKFSLTEIKNIIFSISNSKGLPQNSTLKIKPALKIGNKLLKAPTYFNIDVSNN